jgi:hypothetical protein
MTFTLSENKGEKIMDDTEYENLKKLPLKELAKKITGSSGGLTPEFAKLVYDERMMEQQHEYAKQQIELQHTKNMELLSKQLRWIKFSAILNAIAIIAAVVLGWFLSELKSSQTQLKNTQQMLKSQIGEYMPWDKESRGKDNVSP